jgi:streptogramin lyase
MKSQKGLAIAWVTLCCFSVPVFAGILQPGDIVFADGGLDMVIRLDPNTHATNHIAAIDFTGASGGIAVGRNGDIYVMRFSTINQRTDFFRINGQTGATNRFSNETLIFSGSRMKVSPDGLSLVVAGEMQTAGRGVFRVDLATGHQTIITTNLTDSPDYERPWDVAFSPQGHIYVTDWNYANLLRFNADGTGRHVVTSDGLLNFPAGIDVAADGTIYIASRSYRGIVRVNPVTGQQSSVTTLGYLSFPTDLTVAPDGTLLVAEASADVIVRVDPATGAQTLLHSGTPGPRSPCVFWPAPPALSAQKSGTSLVISWTDAANGWQLQTSETPASASSWADSGLTVDANGDQRAVTVQLNLAALYFRLRKL